jgi:hypothetical protein
LLFLPWVEICLPVILMDHAKSPAHSYISIYMFKDNFDYIKGSMQCLGFMMFLWNIKAHHSSSWCFVCWVEHCFFNFQVLQTNLQSLLKVKQEMKLYRMEKQENQLPTVVVGIHLSTRWVYHHYLECNGFFFSPALFTWSVVGLTQFYIMEI